MRREGFRKLTCESWFDECATMNMVSNVNAPCHCTQINDGLPSLVLVHQTLLRKREIAQTKSTHPKFRCVACVCL